MRLLLISFCYLSFFSSLSHGQTKHTKLGVSLFPSVEGFYYPGAPKDAYRNREKLSYNFGLRTKSFITNSISINSGLMIYNKGRAYTSMLLRIPNQNYSSVVLSSNSWFLSVPLIFQWHIPLRDQHSISPAAGIIYGRKVFQYFHQAGPSRSFYSIISDGTSENHLGLSFGLSYTFGVMGKAVELSPGYIRQINSEWKWPVDSTIRKRYDSYVLELTVFGLIT
jgi:hypothetical protein